MSPARQGSGHLAKSSHLGGAVLASSPAPTSLSVFYPINIKRKVHKQSCWGEGSQELFLPG